MPSPASLPSPYAHAYEDPTSSDGFDEIHSDKTGQEHRVDSPPRFTLAATTLDAPDARELARFYQGLLGWRVRKEEPGRVETAPSDGTAGLSFRTEPPSSRPRWPSTRTGQQMMAHPDIEVDDLSSTVEHALASGGGGPGRLPAPGRCACPVRPGGPPVLPLRAHRPGRLTDRADNAHAGNDG
ncbi:VOC family protein [Streptomyces sp. NPDC020731]|uniref:VOC family protein n=1 Tax=Streptomyces sp. NPDC020731 TaxID=3365085 RepID=UPI0037B48362